MRPVPQGWRTGPTFENPFEWRLVVQPANWASATGVAGRKEVPRSDGTKGLDKKAQIG